MTPGYVSIYDVYFLRGEEVLMIRCVCMKYACSCGWLKLPIPPASSRLSAYPHTLTRASPFSQHTHRVTEGNTTVVKTKKERVERPRELENSPFSGFHVMGSSSARPLWKGFTKRKQNIWDKLRVKKILYL